MLPLYSDTKAELNNLHSHIIIPPVCLDLVCPPAHFALSAICQSTMNDKETTWQTVAQAKRQSILDAIPPKWRLPEPALPPATEVRDVTGTSIQQSLTPHEVEITETDAVRITEKTTSGQWTAVEVAEAFCHRAALAHQLVCE